MTELPWKPIVYLPANLTVRFSADVLRADDPAPWCQGKAAELLGPDASRRQVHKLANCLEEYAGHFRSAELPTSAAAFFWPDFSHLPPRAMAKVYLVAEDPLIGPMTLARAREIYQPDELSFGKAEISEIEVPTGPALRVHRYRKAEPDKRRTRIGEEVAWVICPPGAKIAIMMITMWMEPTFSKAAITIADDMAKNFRIEPAG